MYLQEPHLKIMDDPISFTLNLITRTVSRKVN